jgi:hypothetical protein
MRACITMFIAAFLGACSSGPQADEPPTPDEARRAVQDEPEDESRRLALPDGCEGLEDQILVVQPTRAALHARFGAPDSVIGEAQPNRHVEGVTDSIFTVYYPGLVVNLHMPGGGTDLTVHVDVEHNRYLAFPRIGIGAAADSVMAALGPPTQREPATLIYDCGEAVEQPVRFALSDNRVRRILVDYYVD